MSYIEENMEFPESKIVNPFFSKSPEDVPQTCHLFSVPHNPSHINFSCCAYAQKTRKLYWMLKSLGYTVYHYGNEFSIDKESPYDGVLCDDHITVTTFSQLLDAYPSCIDQFGHVDYTFPEETADARKYLEDTYTLNTVYEAKKRYKPGDHFCYVVPTIQRSLFRDLQDLPVHHVETGVGYYGSYLPYRVFESPAIRAWHYGYFFNNFEKYNKLSDEEKKDYIYNPNTHMPPYSVPTYDAVIPNSVDISHYDFRVKKDNYLLYLGRIISSKGVKTAVRIAEELGMKLVVAGAGDFEKELGIKPGKHVEVVGPVGVEERRDLLSKALALLCPSEYWEPFGGVHVEAMLSGTPPISSNVGGFVDTIRSGYNGYRLSMNQIEEGIWTCENLDKIDPFVLRDFGLRFSNEQIALRYNDYFQNLTRAVRHNGETDYVLNPGRKNLDWIDYDRKIEWPVGWTTPVDVALAGE